MTTKILTSAIQDPDILFTVVREEQTGVPGYLSSSAGGMQDLRWYLTNVSYHQLHAENIRGMLPWLVLRMMKVEREMIMSTKVWTMMVMEVWTTLVVLYVSDLHSIASTIEPTMRMENRAILAVLNAVIVLILLRHALAAAKVFDRKEVVEKSLQTSSFFANHFLPGG